MKTWASDAPLALLPLPTSNTILASLPLVLPFLYLWNGHDNMTCLFVQVLEKKLISDSGNQWKTAWNVWGLQNLQTSESSPCLRVSCTITLPYILLDPTFIKPGLRWAYLTPWKRKALSQHWIPDGLPPSVGLRILWRVPTKHTRLLSADEITKGRSVASSASVGQVFPWLIFARGTQFFWPPEALVCSQKTCFCFHTWSLPRPPYPKQLW